MPIPFPVTITPERVVLRPHHAVATYDNPLTLGSEVQSLGGFRWEIDITMQLIGPGYAETLAAFLQQLEGGAETFSFNLTPWAPGWDPAPGIRNFTLADPATSFSARLATEFNFTFSAIEAL